jgi:hypothetical protein
VAPRAVGPLVAAMLRDGDGAGVDTSSGLLFNHSLWARDRAVTAFDLLAAEPRVALDTALALASLQGRRYRTLSEEEPGRIHNERRDMLDWRAPLWLKAAFGLVLAPLWGGTPFGYTTYFASDSTPLFVLLVAALARRDPEVLDLPVPGRRPATTLRDAVGRACVWIEGHVSDAGLVELGHANPLALQQVWRDGPTSNCDERGRMPNVLRPVAYLDVQVLAVAALAAAADLEIDRPERLRALAHMVRDATIERFRLPERRFFGHAIDRAPDGSRRLLRSIQSNPALMLATGFFDDLPADRRAELVDGVVRMLFSPELLSDAGLRGRGLSDHNPRFRSYHENVWPVDTAVAARGLRRQGLDELADELEARLLNVANMLGGVFEFVAVDAAGHVVDPRLGAGDAARLFGRAVPGLPTEMVPDEPMGWTATALLAIKRERAARARTGRALTERRAARPAWQQRLVAEVLASIEHVEVCATREQLEERYVTLAPLYLDHGAGLRRSARMVAVQGFLGVVPRELARRVRARLTGRSPGD